MTHDDIAAALVAQTWVFAKTMPENPHEYCLRKKWVGDVPFGAVVTYIREHGYALRFKGRYYVCLDIGTHRHWSMGAPLAATILINRAINERKH